MRPRSAFIGVMLASLLVALLLLPIITLLVRSSGLSGHFFNHLNQEVVREALRLSLITTTLSMVITVILGTPLAYVMARGRFWGKGVLDVLLDLPLVLPPVVAGVGLLLVFGRRGLFGGVLDQLGVSLAFSTSAVVIAQVFTASPLYVRAMKAGFASVPKRLESIALTLGSSPSEVFWRVTVPLTFTHMVEGVVLAWARALGEFGATVVFAGSFAGRTRTMPLAIYATLERDLDAALAIAALLTVVAFVLLLSFRLVVARFRHSYA